MKRKMRELFRLNCHLLQQKQDLWVVMKRGFDRDTAEEIERVFIASLIDINGP